MIEESNRRIRDDKLDWHSAFEGGLRLCLRQYEEVLSITREHTLSRQPLRIDYLVVKKQKDVFIDNEIGKIFLNHNIIEYKNPDDSLDIDVLWKAIGYAGIYKSLGKRVDEIPAEELTISIFRMRKPNKLFNQLEKAGNTITHISDGIYQVHGVICIPLYIVVMGELKDDDSKVLRIITKNADEETVRKFTLEASSYQQPTDKRYAEMVMQVVASANIEMINALKGDELMNEAFRTVISDWLEEAEESGALKNTISLVCKKLAKGLEVDTITRELEVEEDVIVPIVKAAEQFAPDYDVDKIYKALKDKEK